MNGSRKYAEDLVGALKTEHYDTQRNVANQVNETNWQKLANEYKNLQENLEMKRQANNRAFAKGLVNVAESSYDQSRAGAQNLAQRGLNVSGMQNLVQQADTANKGERVLGLLNNLGENVTANMEKLSDATSKVAQKEAQLGADLADTLGDIGAAQTNAQMNYNAGLAEIAGNKDARDMENEMARLQREAQAAANARSRAGNGEIDDKIEEFYKRQAVASILQGVDPETGEELDWDDTQKANALKILLRVNDADKVVSNYNDNLKVSERNEKYEKNYYKDLDELAKEITKQEAFTRDDIEKIYASANKIGNYTVKKDKEAQKNIDLILDYITSGDNSIVRKADVSDVLKAIDSVDASGYSMGYGALSKENIENKLKGNIIKDNIDALISDKNYNDNLLGAELFNNMKNNEKYVNLTSPVSFDDLMSQIDAYKKAQDEYNKYKRAGKDYKDYKDFNMTFFE